MMLAGCGGVGDGPDREPFSVPETTTSAAEPSETDPMAVEPPFSPDPETDTLGDPSVFLNSQSRRLAETSYSLDYALDVRYDNGTTWNRVAIEAAFARNRSIYRSNVTNWGRGTNLTRLLYANGTVLFSAGGPAGLEPTDTDWSVAPAPPSEASTFRGLRPEFVYTGFASMNVTEVRELDRVPSGIDEQLFQVRATTVERPETLIGSLVPAGSDARVTNATLEAIVAHDGFVYEYHIDYTVVRADGTRLQVSRRLVYRDVGRTNVTVPDWLPGNTTV